MLCLPDCDNTANGDGFFTCLPDGTPIEPDLGSAWLHHYYCARCGRFFDMNTGLVIGRQKAS